MLSFFDSFRAARKRASEGGKTTREGGESSFALALLRLLPAFALCRIVAVLASSIGPGETSEFLQSPK